METIKIYTDISVDPESQIAGWAFAIHYKNSVKVRRGVLKRKTKDTAMAELQCIANAVWYINRRFDDAEVEVYTDSSCAYKAFIEGKGKKRWFKITRLIHSIIKESKMSVTMRHIEGHNGDPLNEIAHENARAAMVTQRYTQQVLIN